MRFRLPKKILFTSKLFLHIVISKLRYRYTFPKFNNVQCQVNYVSHDVSPRYNSLFVEFIVSMYRKFNLSANSMYTVALLRYITGRIVINSICLCVILGYEGMSLTKQILFFKLTHSPVEQGSGQCQWNYCKKKMYGIEMIIGPHLPHGSCKMQAYTVKHGLTWPRIILSL